MMYATFAQFTAVYSVAGVTQSQIEAHWLPYGALRVNECLGGSFTTPFSSNNATARDLSIQFAYYGMLLRSRKKDDSDELWRELGQRVKDIRDGNLPMITDSGDTQFSSTATRASAWSSTQNYKPVFDFRSAECQRIDPDLIQDTFDQDV